MNEQLKIIISAEVGKLKQGVKEAQGAVSTFKNEVSKHKKDIQKAWTTVGEGAVKASKAILTGVAGATTALVALAASTKEYRTEQAKLTTAFETAGASADTAKQTYNDLFRVIGDSGVATEAAGHLAQLTTNEKDLAEWTNICQGVYATFGDSIPIEGLTEAANETAKVGAVTGSLADALNWAGISEDDFNEKLAATNSEAEREQLIRETLNGLYSEAAATYEETAADVLAQNEAQASLEQTLADLGEALQPVVTMFTQFASDALEVAEPYIKDFAEKYMPDIKDAMEGMSSALEPIAAFLAEHWQTIVTIGGIILGIAAAYKIYSAVMAAHTAITTVHTAVTKVATAVQAAFAAVNWAAVGPILLVVAAIAAVIAIIVLCVKHWDEIKEKVTEVVGNIKEKVSEGFGKVVGKFQELKDNATQKISDFKTNVSNKFGEIKESMSTKIQEAKDKVLGIFTNLKGDIQTKIYAIRDKVKDVFVKVKGFITNPIETAKNTVYNLIEKIKGFFDFEWELPKLKMPSITITGKFSLSPLQVPKFSISWNEMGGIFDKPTLFSYGNSLQGLGENGAEAVVPLEKNTKWLDKIADKLAQKQGTTPIILQVDGKTFAQISVESINELTRQTGNLPLKLA